MDTKITSEDRPTTSEALLAGGRSALPLRVILFLLPVGAALNPILPTFGPLPSFFLITLVLLIGAVVGLQARERSSGIRPLVVLLSALILAHTGFALMTSFGVAWVHAESIVVTAGALIALSVCLLFAGAPTLMSLVHGWLLAFLITGALGSLEYFTGERFGPHYLESNPLASDIGVASTFYNPNNYAAFIVLAVPFLALGATAASNRVLRILYGASVVATVPLILTTGSRFGIALLFVFFAIWFLLRAKKWAVLFTAFFALLALLAAFFAAGPARESPGAEYWGDTTFTISILGMTVPVDGSLYARWSLALNGLRFLESNPLIGIGPGQFEHRMQNGDVPFDTLGIINPHNGVIELLSQYGLLVFGVFVVLAVAVVRVAFRARTSRIASPLIAPTSASLIAACAILPIATLMHSSFLENPYVWVALASMLVSALYLSRESARHEAMTLPSGESGDQPRDNS